MRLPVIVHLQAVFDSAQRFIRPAQCLCLARLYPSGLAQYGQRRAGVCNAERGVAATVDELVGLCKKLAFTNAAMPTFDIEAGTKLLALAIMSSDLCSHRGDVFQLSEIERLSPDKRLDGIQEIIAQHPVTRAYPRTDEGGLFPCQRA